MQSKSRGYKVWTNNEKSLLDPYIKHDGRIKWADLLQKLPGRTAQQCNSYINNRRVELRREGLLNTYQFQRQAIVSPPAYSTQEIQIISYINIIRIDSLYKFNTQDGELIARYMNHIPYDEINRLRMFSLQHFPFLHDIDVNNSCVFTNQSFRSIQDCETALLFFQVLKILKLYVEDKLSFYSLTGLEYSISALIQQQFIITGDASLIQYVRCFSDVNQPIHLILCVINQMIEGKSEPSCCIQWFSDSISPSCASENSSI